MKNLPFHNLNLYLKSDHLAAMGAVACMATRLEDHLTNFLEALAGASNPIAGLAHHILVDRWSNYQKRKKIMTLAREFHKSDPEFIHDLERLMKRAYKLMKKRNRLFHWTSAPAFDEEGNADLDRIIFMGPNVAVSSGLKVGVEEFSSKTTARLASDLKKLCDDCAKMYPKIRVRMDRLIDASLHR